MMGHRNTGNLSSSDRYIFAPGQIPYLHHIEFCHSFPSLDTVFMNLSDGSQDIPSQAPAVAPRPRRVRFRNASIF